MDGAARGLAQSTGGAFVVAEAVKVLGVLDEQVRGAARIPGPPGGGKFNMMKG